MAEAQGTLARIEGTFTSPVGKAMLLGGLALALQIPVLGIWELVGERDARRGEAQAEVSSKWGRARGCRARTRSPRAASRPTGRSPSWAGTSPSSGRPRRTPERSRRRCSGVDLYTPVDAYRATERSLKYQVLFLALTFVVIWLIEVRARARVHVIQYGLIGAALCVFYLLELALAEHLGLAAAYALGALAVASLVFYYALGVLGTRRRALSIAGLISGLYAYLYALLQIADYALLAGALGVFAALAAISVATRRVDWYALSRRGEPEP